MNRNTAVAKLAQAAPTDAEIRRVLHTLSSDELRKYLKNADLALNAALQHKDPDTSVGATIIIRRTLRIAQAILDSRVCVASY